jgi:RND family efflux transporter MFP subunit
MIKKRKKIIAVAVALIAILVIARSNKTDDSSTYQFSTVEKRDLVETVSETGEITTSNKVEIKSTITGVVREVYVDNGAEVNKGDELFYVDSTATQAERSAAFSSYQGAKATLEQAEASQYNLQAKMLTEWRDYMDKTEEDNFVDTDSEFRNLVEFNVPQKEWLAAEADYKAQTEVLSKAKAALNKAWLDYQATTDGPVKATTDGMVANLSIAEGQNVNAADSALIIKKDSQIWIEVAINENDIVDINSGQKATVAIDALSGKEFSATVERVDEFGTLISDLMVYYVYLTLTEGDKQIKPGMTTQIDITTQEKNDVIAIPTVAIKPYQGEKAVRIMDKSKNILYKPVLLGSSDDNYTEIISGLSEGEEIITGEASSTQSKSGGIFSSK